MKKRDNYYTGNSYRLEVVQRLLLPMLCFISAVVVGTLGYTLIEKFSFLNSLYLTVSSIFLTVSYLGNISLTEEGKLFTVFFLMFGVFSLFYAVGAIIEFIVDGNLIKIRRKKKMEMKIKNLKDHYIICGFGRVGHQIAAEFLKNKIDFVVVDAKPETAQELETRGIPYIIGVGSDDEILGIAGIDHAKGLLAVNDSDAENIYVTLSARNLNPDLFIAGRAASKDSITKLKKAGANRVISPYYIAAERMASMALNPVTVEFLDTVMSSENIDLSMREFKIGKGSKVANKTVAEADIRRKTGAVILGIKKGEGLFDIYPESTHHIKEGDVMIALGTNEQLEAAGKMV